MPQLLYRPFVPAFLLFIDLLIRLVTYLPVARGQGRPTLKVEAIMMVLYICIGIFSSHYLMQHEVEEKYDIWSIRFGSPSNKFETADDYCRTYRYGRIE